MSIESELRKFQSQLRKEADLADAAGRKFVADASVDLLRRLVSRTPLRTGHARGNWQATEGTPASQEIPKDRSTSMGPQEVIAAGAAKIKTALKPSKRRRRIPNLFISNLVPYVEILETGTSSQAPNGWIAISILESEAAFASRT